MFPVLLLDLHFLWTGWPLNGFTTTDDREDEQRKELENFYSERILPLGDKFFEDDITGNLKVSYGSLQVQQLFLFNQVGS